MSSASPTSTSCSLAFVVVYIALRFVNDSRTGRAWRSLREDALAAELMGMPVNGLKLLAFSFGAAVAAFSGTFFAALNGSVFPQTFSFALLITIYTMVILGGAGSQTGVVGGAVLVSVMLELLREPGDARWLFYATVLLGLIAIFRFTIKLAVVLIGTAVLRGRRPRDRLERRLVVDRGGRQRGRAAPHVSDWVLVPAHLESWVAPTSYILLIALMLVLTLIRGWYRIALLIPTLYLAAFVWENVMLVHPEATRYIVIGAMLIALMVARPTGLLGEKRVEII